MAGIKRLTGIALLTTGEGNRVAYTYSILDSEGNMVSGNNKGSFVALDSELETHINAIREYIINSKLPEK